MARAPPFRPGWVVTPLTRSPPSQTSRSCSRKPARYCFPVRAPIGNLPVGFRRLRHRAAKGQIGPIGAEARVDSAVRLLQDAVPIQSTINSPGGREPENARDADLWPLCRDPLRPDDPRAAGGLSLAAREPRRARRPKQDPGAQPQAGEGGG